MEVIVIFGGSGFIGTHLSKLKLEAGWKVYCVDIVKPRIQHENLVYLKHDVRNLSNLCIEEKVKLIYNFAAIHTTPGHATHEYYETNVLGADQVCRFAERSDIDEIVFTSSISVYGPDEELKDESSELKPNSSYGYSKKLSEKIHESWFERDDNRKLTIVRPAVVFGPGEGGNFTRLAAMMRKGLFVYPGRKDTIKACIYVDDLIYAFESARETTDRLELLNGAYAERYTLEDIVTCFKNIYFPDVRLFLLPRIFVISIAKLLGFFNFLNIGIHPERVLKLVKSTNIFPSWIVSKKLDMKGDLASALARWHKETNGKFD